MTGRAGWPNTTRSSSLCRDYDVVTPEDPFVVWEGEGGPCALALLFLLYDYSFRPDNVAAEDALDWAAEAGIMCADERYLHPEPHASREAWCRARCDAAEAKLSDAAAKVPLVIINHFPLREELVRLWRIPRFSLWCGTKRTEDWHRRFRAKVVVYGHLHNARYRLDRRRALRGSLARLPEALACGGRDGRLFTGDSSWPLRYLSGTTIPSCVNDRANGCMPPHARHVDIPRF